MKPLLLGYFMTLIFYEISNHSVFAIEDQSKYVGTPVVAYACNEETKVRYFYYIVPI